MTPQVRPPHGPQPTTEQVKKDESAYKGIIYALCLGLTSILSREGKGRGGGGGVERRGSVFMLWKLAKLPDENLVTDL